MRGVIEMANARRGRYAVRIDGGDYTAFELLDAVEIEIGDEIEGSLDRLAGETFSSERHGKFSVYVEHVHASAGVARAWLSAT